MSEVLQYDFLTDNSLFDGQSPSSPDKHKIVTKLESVLEIKNDFENLHDTNNVLAVAFMSLLRRLWIKDFPNFEELLVAGYNYIKVVLKFNEFHKKKKKVNF